MYKGNLKITLQYQIPNKNRGLIKVLTLFQNLKHNVITEIKPKILLESNDLDL